MDDQPRESIEDITLRALQIQRREQGRWIVTALRLTLFLVIPAVGLAGWYFLIGHQRHVLEIHAGDVAVRIISRRSPFEIINPGEDFAKPVDSGYFEQIIDHVRGSSVQPRSYGWAPIARTEQRVDLPPGVSLCEFAINDMTFRIANGEMSSGQQRWLLPRGQIVEVDFDRIPTTNP